MTDKPTKQQFDSDPTGVLTREIERMAKEVADEIDAAIVADVHREHNGR